MPLTLILNGQQRDFAALEDGSFLADLIATLELKADRIAIEQNGEIIPRSLWPATVIHQKDRIEVVHFVGGGHDA